MVKKNKSMEFDRSVMQYFKDISTNKPLTYEEEYDLWKKYRFNNDITARNRLVNANLKFVANIAKTYIGRGLSFSDLIAEGNVGLIKAMDRFDARKGFKAISYSVWWVRQSILDALRRRNSLEAEDLPSDLDHEDRMGDDESDSSEHFNGYMDSYIDSESDEAVRSDEQRRIIELLFESLDEREQSIVSRYYGLFGNKPETLEKIGKDFGITKERTRQLLGRIFNKMRSVIMEEGIDESVCYAES